MEQMHSSQTLQAWFIRPSPMKHTQPHRVRWWWGSAEQIQPTRRRIRKQCPKVWDMAMPSPYRPSSTWPWWTTCLCDCKGSAEKPVEVLSPASRKLRTHHNSHQNMTWINSWLTWLKWLYFLCQTRSRIWKQRQWQASWGRDQHILNPFPAEAILQCRGTSQRKANVLPQLSVRSRSFGTRCHYVIRCYCYRMLPLRAA